jgi:hypothetical protein
VSGEQRKLHDEEFHYLCSSPNISVIKSRRMSWAGHVARMENKNAYRILLGRPEKRPILIGVYTREWYGFKS